MKRITDNLQTAGLVIVALIVVGAVWVMLSRPSAEVSVPAANSKQMESGLLKLANSEEVSERIAAARFFGEQPPASASTVIQALGRALNEDEDSRVRAAVAASIGNSRRKFGGENFSGLNEPQLLEIMLKAYLSEHVSSVRTEIVLAAGQFNHPEAAELISLALEDHDASVREMAQRVKIAREQRLLRVRIG